jgi:DNA (cytosine-5)-methyltransferase 1
MMCKPLTETLGEELLMLYLGDFHVKTSLSLGGGDGLDGERSGMWREMARIIGEVRPKYAFVENSPMLTTRGLGTVLRDLAQLGFNAEWGVLGADEIGANHKRKRIWIVAYSNSNSDFWSKSRSNGIQNKTEGITRTQYSSTWKSSGTSNVFRKDALQGYEKSNMAYSSSENVERQRKSIGIQEARNTIGSSSWWKVEPRVDRVANGVDARVDRLKAIGNGQVPLCAATAWRLLNERI